MSFDEARSSMEDLGTRYDTIQGWLYKNRGSFDEESYKSFTASLDEIKRRFDGTKDYFSQWDNDSDYQASLKDLGYRKQYEGLSYDDIQKKLFIMPKDTEEYSWLQAYAPTIMTQDDYDNEISNLDAQIVNMEAALEEYRKLVPRQSTANPDNYANARMAEIVKQYGSEADIKAKLEELKAAKLLIYSYRFPPFYFLINLFPT